MNYTKSFLPVSKFSYGYLCAVNMHYFACVACLLFWNVTCIPQPQLLFQAQLPPEGTSFSVTSYLLGNYHRSQNKLCFLEKICYRRYCPEWAACQRGWYAIVFGGREVEKEVWVGVGGVTNPSVHSPFHSFTLFVSFFLSELEKTQSHPCRASEGPAWLEININLDWVGVLAGGGIYGAPVFTFLYSKEASALLSLQVWTFWTPLQYHHITTSSEGCLHFKA